MRAKNEVLTAIQEGRNKGEIDSLLNMNWILHLIVRSETDYERLLTKLKVLNLRRSRNQPLLACDL
jgi:hypothetical protein